MKWDPTLETGHELVDSQHKELISIFTELSQATRPGSGIGEVEALLIRLSDYVATHFAAEERLMEESGYPTERIAEHEAQHTRLTERTRQLVLEHRLGKASAFTLAALLQEWIVEHISGHDRDLVAHIRQRELGQQAG